MCVCVAHRLLFLRSAVPFAADDLVAVSYTHLQNRTVAFLENGSWAPVSVKHMTDTFASLKNMKVLEESLTIRSSLKNCQGDCLEALVDSIFQSLA